MLEANSYLQNTARQGKCIAASAIFGALSYRHKTRMQCPHEVRNRFGFYVGFAKSAPFHRGTVPSFLVTLEGPSHNHDRRFVRNLYLPRNHCEVSRETED